MRLGRSTGHPGRASTTPEMSAVGPDGRPGPDAWTEPDGCAEPVAAGRTPQDAVTRTRPAAASSHRARGAGHRVVVITGTWTARRGGRFPRGEVHREGKAPARLPFPAGAEMGRRSRQHVARRSSLCRLVHVRL